MDTSVRWYLNVQEKTRDVTLVFPLLFPPEISSDSGVRRGEKNTACLDASESLYPKAYSTEVLDDQCLVTR